MSGSHAMLEANYYEYHYVLHSASGENTKEWKFKKNIIKKLNYETKYLHFKEIMLLILYDDVRSNNDYVLAEYEIVESIYVVVVFLNYISRKKATGTKCCAYD